MVQEQRGAELRRAQERLQREEQRLVQHSEAAEARCAAELAQVRCGRGGGGGGCCFGWCVLRLVRLRRGTARHPQRLSDSQSCQPR